MRFVLLLAAVALAACNRSSSYAPGVEINFVRACEAQSTVPGLCECTWDRIEAQVSPDDLNALELLPGPEREAHPLTAQINGYALACASELGREPAAPR